MRTVFILFMAGMPLAALAQSTLQVELIMDRPDAGGTMRVALCPDERAYRTEQGCRTQHAVARGDIVRAIFTGLPEGTYAVKVFHDVDDNGRMNVNWLGIPTEPYGFSNDAMGTFGPPDFKAASFKVGAGSTTIRIRMKG